jgi:hypothetical protein
MKIKHNEKGGMVREYQEDEISKAAHHIIYAKAMLDIFGCLGESASVVDTSNLMVLSIEAEKRLDDALKILKA